MVNNFLWKRVRNMDVALSTGLVEKGLDVLGGASRGRMPEAALTAGAAFAEQEWEQEVQKIFLSR